MAGDRLLTNENAQEFGNAILYRHYGKVFEKNDRGPINDQFGRVAETVRSRLFVGLGAGVVLTLFAVTSREPFLIGMGFLPLVIFAGWLIVRWNTAREARKKQLEILAWFKARGIPFPYENAAEIIDPFERMDWEDARTKARLAELQAAKADQIETRKAELKYFNWEYRPAVFDGKAAWAVVKRDGDWEEVSYVEVLDSGYPVFSAMFDELFPNLPPMRFLDR